MRSSVAKRGRDYKAGAIVRKDGGLRNASAHYSRVHAHSAIALPHRRFSVCKCAEFSMAVRQAYGPKAGQLSPPATNFPKKIFSLAFKRVSV